MSTRFNLTLRQIEDNLVIRTHAEIATLREFARDDNTEATEAAKQTAKEDLFHTHAAAALEYGVNYFRRSSAFRLSYEEVEAASFEALWACIKSWSPTKGLTFEAWLKHVLAGEFARALQQVTLREKGIDALAVSAIRNRIESSPQTAFHTGYGFSYAEKATGEIVFPYAPKARKDAEEAQAQAVKAAQAEVAQATKKANAASEEKKSDLLHILARAEQRLEKVVKACQPIVLDEYPFSKSNVAPAFSTKGLNKPRAWKRAKTGFQSGELAAAGAAFDGSGKKLTSDDMLYHALSRPARTMRREDINADVILAELKDDRRRRSMELGKKWTWEYVAQLIEEEVTVLSYDNAITDSDGDEMGFRDSIVAPEKDLDDDEVVETYSDSQLASAGIIAQQIQARGLQETLERITLKKFLHVYWDMLDNEDGASTRFAALCSKFGVRIRLARELCQLVDDNFSEFEKLF